MNHPVKIENWFNDYASRCRRHFSLENKHHNQCIEFHRQRLRYTRLNFFFIKHRDMQDGNISVAHLGSRFFFRNIVVEKRYKKLI